MSGPIQYQRGIALVTAMLIVAIVATLAAYLGMSQQVNLRQAQNISDLTQADNISRGAIRYAGVLLARDAKNNNTDGLNEDWNKPVSLPVEGGFVTIRVEDAQSRFNLNNLVTGNVPNRDEIAVFRNLLLNQNLDPALSEALVDWLDDGSSSQPGGAEDIDYLTNDPPYRAANQALASVDELRRVKGFTDEALKKLRPFVVALPGLSRRAININTAPTEVLAALVGLPPAALTPVARKPTDKPFTEPGELTQQLQLNKKIDASHGVQTAFFLVTIETHIGRSLRRIEALVERRPNGALTHWQQQPPIQIQPDDPKT